MPESDPSRRQASQGGIAVDVAVLKSTVAALAKSVDDLGRRDEQHDQALRLVGNTLKDALEAQSKASSDALRKLSDDFREQLDKQAKSSADAVVKQSDATITLMKDIAARTVMQEILSVSKTLITAALLGGGGVLFSWWAAGGLHK